MPELRNPRYEIVAHALAEGSSQLKACHAAGYTMKTHAPAHRICHRPDVMARVAELKGHAEKIRDMREELRQKAKEGVSTGKAVTKEYLLLELQDQLARARALGNTREGLTCLKLMAIISGNLGVKKGPIGRPSTKKAKEETEQRDAPARNVTDPDPEAGPPGEILSDQLRLLERLDQLSSEDTEDGA